MQKVNTEFNYRFQVKGETPWERIKVLKGFLEGRQRVLDNLPSVELKRKAAHAELEYLKNSDSPPHVVMRMQADIMEMENMLAIEEEGFELTRQEVKIIKTLLQELYDIVEPTRLKHEDGSDYTDEEMFEINAANEFTAMIGKEMYAEILATGRPSPAKLLNAMSNPYTFTALKNAGLIPKEALMLTAGANPLKIELKQDEVGVGEPPSLTILKV